MKKLFLTVISLMIVYSFLTAYSSWAYAFVTPEHYEKIKQQAREKGKNQEKPTQTPPLGKIQVHPPNEGPAPLKKLNPK